MKKSLLHRLQAGTATVALASVPMIAMIATIATMTAACSTDENNMRAGAAKAKLHSGDDADGGTQTDGAGSQAPTSGTGLPNDSDHHPSGSGSGSANKGSGSGDGSVAPAAESPRVGIRNFRQINDTMAYLTGVPRTNATVAAAFAALATALPDSNDIRTFNGSHQVAISKLAVEYCDAMIEDPALSAAAVPGFDYTKLPAVAFDAGGKALVAKSLIEKFWGTGLESLPSEDETIADVVAMIGTIAQGNDAAGKAKTTKNVVKGVCTGLLSTGEILIL